MRFLTASAAVFSVMLAAGCSDSGNSADITPIISDSVSDKEADISEITSVEAEEEVNAETDLFALYKANTKVKESYDVSYGSEIACTAFVLNYLGFETDEPEIASYLAYDDHITGSEIKSTIDAYFSDTGVTEYEVSTGGQLIDISFDDGFPRVVRIMLSDSQSAECFVLTGSRSDMTDPEKSCYFFYDPYSNTLKEYSDNDFTVVDFVSVSLVKSEE